ncbi:protein max-like isoform X2 [Lethenteron reissneri]|uniref:protein max-like isoform X2 n=1 Tax=Lethenteron reissneri TaxID=7753 RepID=UPI002AB79DE3|nr:protein max-like isoform X2 [Lethenteron reissneri]
MSDIDDEFDSDDDQCSRFQNTADKRAHHNALERKRRDHIKDSFHGLRDSIPAIQGEKASRALILNKATDYIQHMKRRNNSHQQDIDDLKKQNSLLEQQVRALEKARVSKQQAGTSSPSGSYVGLKGRAASAAMLEASSSSDSEAEPKELQSRKKLRTEPS